MSNFIICKVLYFKAQCILTLSSPLTVKSGLGSCTGTLANSVDLYQTPCSADQSLQPLLKVQIFKDYMKQSKSLFRALFPAYTQRQSTHQCFDYSLIRSTESALYRIKRLSCCTKRTDLVSSYLFTWPLNNTLPKPLSTMRIMHKSSHSEYIYIYLSIFVFRIYIQSTLVISNSKGLTETL